jgi:pyruvate dehydrogenase E1 component beta subunit
MEVTLRDTIKSIIKDHLQNKIGKVYGQCLTAVGWVGGTLPELYEEDGMIELSMADVAGGSIVTGAALANTRPIYVVRYQGFQWYNCVSIINYAAKSKEIWQRKCPVFVRSIAMEGSIGPVAGSSHHALFYRMPGLKIASPMSPSEYHQVYNSFLSDDCPYYVSEHRKSYDNSKNLVDIVYDESDVTLVCFSVTRFEAIEASKKLLEMGIKCSVLNQLWIKPFIQSDILVSTLKNTKKLVVVLDDDYISGISESIAYKISKYSKTDVECLGLDDKTAGFSLETDNLPPDCNKIIEFIIRKIN